jgi:penicillin-binding protein 1A
MTKKKSNFVLKLIFLLFSLGIALGGILFVMVVVTYPRLPSMNELQNYQPKLPLQVYSSDGVLLGQFGEEHRVFVSFNNTPKMLINAILSAEDERFYQHGGIDYLGVIRALGLNIISGRKQSGASTITMQVARNFFLTSQKTYSRKFNEVLLSYKIEKSLTKDQILELYINQIYLGQRSYGFGEAALTYFGKPLDQLTIAEYAVLAGLPKAPSAYNPVVNKKRSHEREMYVLGRMKAGGLINDEQYQQAINQPIVVAKGTIKDATDSGGYVAEMVRQMLYDKFGDKIYTDGYKVYTTIDSKMQQAAYNSLRSGLLQYDAITGYKGPEQQLNLKDADSDDITDQIIMSSFDSLSDFGDLRAAIVTDVTSNSIKVKTRDGNQLEFKGKDLDFVRKYINSGDKKQLSRGSVIRIRNTDGKWVITQLPAVEGGLIALNPNDGGMKALIGGFDFTRNNYNHITQAMRQPGSGFKPFIYSSALDKGFSTNTIIDDSEICFPSGGDGGGEWCPKNDDSDFLGPITLRQGLTFSRNIVTIKILNQITPQYAIDYVTKFGFNKSQFQPYLTMGLGASEVTPMQMAQAYAVFANGGYMVTPYLIKTISDNKGNIVAKTDPVDIHKNQPVIDPRNAFIMNSVLQDVVRYGTGAPAYKELHRNDIAGKTGTTNDAKDVWFNGYTPNLVAITWVGYDQPKSLGAHQFGSTLALPIWINFMRQALNGMPETSLVMPSGITVLHNATWKGNDEYIYDGAKPFDGLASAESGSTPNAEASTPPNASGTIVEPASISPHSDESSNMAPANHVVASKPSAAPTATAPSSTVAKPSSVDDIIQNIQD